MKKIDYYIVRAFIGPFLLTFLITLFILLMQFLWKYIDDLVGKGLEWYVVAELLFYASANMVPLALPLAVLLAALMTFGNLGERFELAALKSAGISMFRFMRSAILMGALITLGAFLFSNYVLPHAALKFWSTLIDVTHQKPALNIRENVFYNDIDNYSILVVDKDEDNATIRDITIYDQSESKGYQNILIAEHGRMFTTPDKQALVMKLHEGRQYQRLKPDPKRKVQDEHLRMYFEEWEMAIDLSGFELNRTDSDVYKNHRRMMNMSQLKTAIDSIRSGIDKKQGTLQPVIASYFYFNRDTAYSILPQMPVDSLLNLGSIRDSLNKAELKTGISRAMVACRNVTGFSKQIEDHTRHALNNIAKHKIERHRKITLSLACLLFLFVGAPLGAIIRKGGFGMPVVTSVLIFVIFYVLMITGEKSAEEELMTPFTGMWLPILIMFPFSFFLTIKAKNDSAIMNKEAYYKFFGKLAKLTGFGKPS